MSRAIPPLPNTPSWHGPQLKHRDNFTFDEWIQIPVVARSKARMFWKRSNTVILGSNFARGMDVFSFFMRFAGPISRPKEFIVPEARRPNPWHVQ
jgi:hypothetical protein